MSGLGDWLAGLIGPTIAEGSDWHDVDREEQLRAVLASGSNRALARATGLGKDTFRRLRGGLHAKAPTARVLGIVERQYGRIVAASAIEAAGRIVQGATLHVRQRARGAAENNRPRTLDQTNLRFAADAGQKVAEAYAKGGAERAAAAYVAQVRETDFYKPWLAAGLASDWDHSSGPPTGDDDSDDDSDDDYDWVYDLAEELFDDEADAYGFGVE